MSGAKETGCKLAVGRLITARNTLQQMEKALASAQQGDLSNLLKLKKRLLVEIAEIEKDIYVFRTRKTWMQFFMEVREANTKTEAEELLDNRVVIYRDSMETQLNSPRHFSNLHFTTLPDNLVVPGNLVLDHCYIKRLPKNLKIKEKLDLSFSKIDDGLSSGLTANELSLKSTGLDKLPDDLRVTIINIDPILVEEAERLKDKKQIVVINV